MSPIMEHNKPFAEIIESSLQRWLCQSWEWDSAPTFGSIIAIPHKKRTIFGIVHQVETGSMDPSRYPFAYKKTEEELRKEQPQIFEFLKTSFSCITIGYQEGGRIFHQLPPEPPKIHAFAEYPQKDVLKQIIYRHRYLPLVCGSASEVFNLDELLLALLKHNHSLQSLSSESLQSFVDQYCLLTGNDYRRLRILMKRIQHMIE